MNTVPNAPVFRDMDAKGRRWIDSTLGTLSLEQKIGQLMVFPHYGPFITPDVVELIRRHHVGGLRIAQKFSPGSPDLREPGQAEGKGELPQMWERPADLDRIACTAKEFAETLNTLRDLALERPGAVPLHMAFDQEGEGADLLFEQRLFPHPLGQAAADDPELVERVTYAIGLQARALGANMIHSPVLDVNTEPGNPEIGPRSYGETAEVVTRFGLAALRGLTRAGIAATGKHFPGRGHSQHDAHFGLPEINLSREEMLRVHVAPFKALIDAGLPCIMAAFTAYPSLGAPGVPAATSRALITGLLREELGFTGVVTTDNVQMGGLLSRYGMGEAVVRCLVAGCDLILCRAYNAQRWHVLADVNAAVRAGRIREAALDASVGRVLALRWRMGLVPDGGRVDANRAGDWFRHPGLVATAEEAAARCTVVLRDRAGLLPLPGRRRILLIEQVHHFHRFINNSYSHPGMLWQELTRLRPDITTVAINEKYNPVDEEAVMRRVYDADILVSTSYYNYRSQARMIPLLEKLRATGKPLVVVSNTPFERFGVPAWVDTALVSFCPSGREHLRVAAEILGGRRRTTGRLALSRL